MDVEFWSDVVCPYCGLMDHRLHTAIDRFEHGARVRLVHRSFQLHPDLPREGVSQRALLVRYGVPQNEERVLRPLERLAEAEGLVPYHAVERTLGPTDLAHQLLAFASEQGRGAEIWTAMFRAHFGEARPFWTREDVLAFAAEVGLDRDDAAAALDSHRYRARVAADQRAAERLGAHGTPFVVLDGAYALNGAVSVDDLVAALRTAWTAGHHDLVPLADAGGTCTPDGCLVPRT
ncbi:DsbA family oxidoreductase [Amycolatopsis rhabdoformis]|uniref:DsbA family oxidoreductase n=1 Tax=Amycolatopsis rhabdoformis TaxID=1448059 RepID=A0ABZ1IJC9_9PSEU|nr:DsbA family oxidoreductase [Amycolatopsis rhabdoformis]WSE34559.1 DsbA family oxidoreductase [Amycolatopsis rhabdoformis]